VLRRCVIAVLAVVAASCAAASEPTGPSSSAASLVSTAVTTPVSPTAALEPLDAAAVLRMMKQYVGLYDASQYLEAVRFLSNAVLANCGGAIDLASALEQNHQIEGIDYEVEDVRAWGPDRPKMADVVTREIYSGDSHPIALGLAFTFEDGEWKLDDLYPLGAGAFC
jgi:hypothetical protein